MATGSLVGRSVEADVTHRVAQAEDVDGTEVSRTLETRFENLVGHTAGTVNVHSYGSTGTHLAAAAAAATAAGAELVIAHPIAISTAVGTISCPVRMVGAGRLVTATGGSVTLTGPFVSDLSHRFDTSAGGTITFSAQCPEVYPQWWGAKGDGVTDDTAALNASLAATPHNGTCKLANTVAGSIAQFLFSASLIIPRAMKLQGAGYGTVLLAKSTLGATSDMLIFRPTTGTGSEYAEISNLYILPESGTPGRDGIKLDLSAAGTSLQKLLVDRVVVRARAGRALATYNPSADHDAVFASIIRDCSLAGGIYLQGAGDSISILNNTITSNGSATADGCKWGVEVDLISTVDPLGADSSCLLIQGNNITTQGGALYVKKGPRTRFLYNNCELYGPSYSGTYVTNATNNPNKAFIDIDGLSAKHVSQCEIRGNFLGPTTHSVNDIIRVNYADDTIIEDNTIYPTGTAGGGWGYPGGPYDATWYGINVTANAVRTRIGPQVWDPAGIVANRVGNAGVSTIGVAIPIAGLLENSWVIKSTGWTSPAAVIHADGLVTLEGQIYNGTFTAGTRILLLPTGMRPLKYTMMPVLAHSGGVPILGQVSITDGGEVLIAYLPAAEDVDLSQIRFYAW